MRVVLRHPTREIEVDGPKTVRQLLGRLEIVSESVLVIRGDELLTEDDHLGAEDTIELRPVISGG